jgi:two-component system NarL family sensor kinase
MDPEVGALLMSLNAETSDCVAEVKRIVTDLRPAALDQIGLVAALTQHADLITSRTVDGLTIDVEADELPALPAAVEAAAYRIALEAVTNVVRHSHADRCHLRLKLDGALHLSIVDDGVGVTSTRPNGGLGLASMRDRAEELGGTCTVARSAGRGTEVVAMLPVTSR